MSAPKIALRIDLTLNPVTTTTPKGMTAKPPIDAPAIPNDRLSRGPVSENTSSETVWKLAGGFLNTLSVAA